MGTLSTLLLLCLTVYSADALRCYVCSSTSTNDSCNENVQTCQAPLDTCMTTIDTLGDVRAIVKQCASRATCSAAASGASVDENGDGNSVSCCRVGLCNYNDAVAIRLPTWLLALSLCLLPILTKHYA